MTEIIVDTRWHSLTQRIVTPELIVERGLVRGVGEDKPGQYPAARMKNGDTLVYVGGAEDGWFIFPDLDLSHYTRTETPVKTILYSGGAASRNCALGPGDRGTMCRPNRKNKVFLVDNVENPQITCGNCIGQIENLSKENPSG